MYVFVNEIVILIGLSFNQNAYGFYSCPMFKRKIQIIYIILEKMLK